MGERARVKTLRLGYPAYIRLEVAIAIVTRTFLFAGVRGFHVHIMLSRRFGAWGHRWQAKLHWSPERLGERDEG
jgi:hypothetical protein